MNQWEVKTTLVSTLLTCMGFYKGKAHNLRLMRKSIPTRVCISTPDLCGFLQRESTQPVTNEETHPYPCINTPDLHGVLQRESTQPVADGNPSLPLFVSTLLTCLGFYKGKARKQRLMRKSIPPYKGKARNQWQMRKPIPTLVSTLLTCMGFYKGKACNQWQMRKPIPTIVSTLLTCMGFYKGKACNQWQMRKPIPTLVCINTLDPSGVLQRESTQPVADEKTHPYPCINTPDLHRVLQRESAQPEADKETHPYPYLHQHSWPAWVFRKGKRTASGRWGNPSLPLFVWTLLTCVGF